MATVTFGVVWFSLAADLTQALPVSLHSVEHTPQVTVTSEVWAGGNSRMFTAPGKVRQAKLTLNFLPAATVAQLKAWQGLLLLYRDPTGEKFYGYFADPDFIPRASGVGTPTALTFTEITVSEEV